MTSSGLIRSIALATIAFCATTVWAQTPAKIPNLGCVYPGGGQQGTTFRVVINGQNIGGPRAIHITGGGVSAKVLQYARIPRNLQREQRNLINAKMKELNDQMQAEKDGRKPNPKLKQATVSRMEEYLVRYPPRGKEALAEEEARKKAGKAPEVKLPNHPSLYGLEEMDQRQMAHAQYEVTFPQSKKQLNPQLAETVTIEVTIAPDAKVGDRELRIEGGLGVSNPIVFQVGAESEVKELEPNDPKPWGAPNLPAPSDLPVVFNGRIMPGDVDTVRFNAKKGQRLVIETSARRLVPFLADSVPGWFQATFSIHDADGKELGFADDYAFDPDPVMYAEVPWDGVYELRVRDSIYRGREDFVYRIRVGEHPFITSVFPLGGRQGAKTVATVGGWNLAKAKLPLDTKAGVDNIRQTALIQGKRVSNPVTYAVDDLPEIFEAEPNNAPKAAQKVNLGAIINGQISQPGDVDVYQIAARAGDELVAEVNARRLRSPLDSVIHVTDKSGAAVEWNDDHMLKDGHLHRDMGLLTHHADSYLKVKLPSTGVYFIKIGDTRGHGSPAHAYRLRLSAPRVDFALQVCPSSLTIPAGRSVPVTVYALRKDGYDGPIKIGLKGAPEGFTVSGGVIPAGQDKVRMTVKSPPKPLAKPINLRLVGRVNTGGEVITRPAIPSDNVMQAFLWRHLAPCQELSVSVPKMRWPTVTAKLADSGPIKVPMGGTADVKLTVPTNMGSMSNVSLTLVEPPTGVSVKNVKTTRGQVTFQVKADADAIESAFSDNLIIEAFANVPVGKTGKAAKQKRRVSLGTLPAIPVEIASK